MGFDRRKFMKLAGVTALTVVSGAGAKALVGADSTIAADTARTKTNLPPLTAKRWAMLVDLRKCKQHEGCDKCIKACHTYHNVPDFGNPKDEVKWIWKEKFEHVFHEQENDYTDEAVKQLPVPLLCNHCDNPPCTRVCPTGATWKRESDGIVMMDWHRCIGCRYCVLACPYGSRSFNWRDPRPHIEETNPDFPTRTRGVVEKCTFCESRLAKGLMPACVDACTEHALIFGDLEDPESEIRQVLGENFTLRRRPELGTNPEVYYIV